MAFSVVCQARLSSTFPRAISRTAILKATSSEWVCSSNKIHKTVSTPFPFATRRTFAALRAQKNEEEAAISATVVTDIGGATIFDKIIKKEIPSTVVYEDELVLAFRDINPQAPTHIVLIPKIRDGLTQLSKAEARHKDILGHLMYTTKVIAKQEGIEDGYRVVINNGPTACQSVYHIHFHILGGRQLKWPPG